MDFVEARNLPGHIGIIMDGNGRWAQLRGQPRAVGHREGASAVRRTVRAARRLGLRALTLYAFSEQNWARPEEEVDAVMQLLRDFLLTERDEILDNGIRLSAVGNLGRLPAVVRAVLDPLRNESARNHEMTLTLALSYGGREEIAHAARELAMAVAAGRMRPEDVTTEALRAHIPSVSVSDPDLIIRTGGERRISNFLLYGVAYAELHFADVLWPDFAEADLFTAIASFQRRERRFGLVNAPEAGSHGANGSNGSGGCGPAMPGVDPGASQSPAAGRGPAGVAAAVAAAVAGAAGPTAFACSATEAGVLVEPLVGTTPISV